MRVFICAGEASGDAYGAAFAAELRKVAPAQIDGIGGPRMAAAGVGLVRQSGGWGVISIAQVLRKLPTLLSGYYAAKRALSAGGDLFVPIDFGYMNIRLARHAKAKGWKVLYFVPPGSWRRDRQGRDLPAVTDAISTPFSWSAEALRAMGANAHWFGHPIKQLLRDLPGEPRNECVAVLPGSRSHEIELNLPLIAAAVAAADRLEFALVSTESARWVEKHWTALTSRQGDRFTVGATASVLKRCRAAIVCSGTATLEAALCGCPQVVVYRLSKTMAAEVKLLRIKRPKYVALPNILLDRPIVPELIQEEATPENLRAELNAIRNDSAQRLAQTNAYAELDQALGPRDAITRTAELAAEMLRGA